MKNRNVIRVIAMIGVFGLASSITTIAQDAPKAPQVTPANPTAAEAPKAQVTTTPPSAPDANKTDAATTTRSLRIPKTVRTMNDGKRWAVIIGIQYSKEERAPWKERGEIPPLKNAENDATDMAKILKEKYGYAEDSIFLLTGKQATRDAIENLLREGLLCDGEKVGPNDSVLFYFSGHGVGPEQGAESSEDHAYLLPCDAQVNEQGRPNTTFAIDIGDVAAKLRKQNECKARHILLILDCCHSGAVFSMQGTPGGAFETSGIDDSLLSTRSVQAIAASRSTQKASDGAVTDRNSPFTGSLLRALEEVPPSLPRERFFFTTNQLFSAMKAYVNTPTSIEQSPQCRWLDGINAGEFIFFPDPQARFDEVSDESRRLLLTMVPSTFGNWWPEEMPWFMPGLRLEILQNRTETKSTLADEIDKTKLREAALLTLKRLKSDKSLDSVKKRRVKHLEVMLESEESAEQKRQYGKVIEELKAATTMPPQGSPEVEAVDVHHLAVLQQLVGDHVSAKASYEKAIELYKEESKRFVRMQALEALCLSDYGMVLSELNDNDAAFDQFRTARSLFGLGAPIPFRVFCLTKEADARRAKGFAGASDMNMDKAISLARTFDPDETHPLTAAAYKHYAWAKMEQWQFHEAEQKFRKTQEILSKKENVDRLECQIDQLHAKHGLAMIHRFQGEDEEAIKGYGSLTREISSEIRGLERRSDRESNLAEVRALLYDRLVNSLERQADCYLFGRRPDYEAAAFSYRRGIQIVGQVPENRRVAIECDLLYRQAIALFLQSLEIDTLNQAEKNESLPVLIGDQRLRKSQIEASEQAHDFLRQQALRVLNRASSLDRGTDLPPINVRLSRAIAEFLAQSAEADHPSGALAERKPADEAGTPVLSSTKQPPKADLNVLLEQLRESKRDFNRDELERLMFAYRLLIQQPDRKIDDFKRLELAERLNEYCRSVLRLANGDAGILTYLRPYFDAVFRVKLKYQPVGTKELIELVWEATTGELDPPPVANHPFLAMYFLDDRCHLILDVPHGRSGRFEIDPEELRSVDLVKKIGEAGQGFPCPDGLRKGLRAIKQARGHKLFVHYRDPVQGLGEPLPQSREITRITRKPPSDTLLNPSAESFLFPFDVRSALADPAYEIKLIEVIDVLRSSKPAESSPDSSNKEAAKIPEGR